MKKFKFEIQNLIKVEIEADNADEAREELIDDLESYSSQLIEDCYVSDGEEIK